MSSIHDDLSRNLNSLVRCNGRTNKNTSFLRSICTKRRHCLRYLLLNEKGSGHAIFNLLHFDATLATECPRFVPESKLTEFQDRLARQIEIKVREEFF